MKQYKLAFLTMVALVAQVWATNCQDDNPANGLPAGACQAQGTLTQAAYIGWVGGADGAQYLQVDLGTIKVDENGKIDPNGTGLSLLHYADPSKGSDALSLMMIGSMASAAKINNHTVNVIYKKDPENPGKFFLIALALW